MGPDASSGLSNPRPNFEDPAPQSFDFEFLPGGSIQIIAESDEHLVSQPMQEKSKLVGQESMTAQPIHTQMVLKSLDEVLRLSSIGVVIIKGLGREIVSVGDHKATIDPPMVDFHFDDDATESIPAAGKAQITDAQERKRLVDATTVYRRRHRPSCA